MDFARSTGLLWKENKRSQLNDNLLNEHPQWQNDLYWGSL